MFTGNLVKDLLPVFMTPPETGMDLVMQFIANQLSLLTDGFDLEILKGNLMRFLQTDQVLFVAFLAILIDEGEVVCKKGLVFLLSLQAFFIGL